MDRIQEFGDFINWPFLIVFIMVAFVINKFFKSPVQKKKISAKFLRTIAVGIGIAAIFFLLGDALTRKEALRFICSIFFAMFIMWDGLKKWFNYFKKKLPNKD